MTDEDKKLFESAKKTFNIKSLKELAVKMNRAENSALNWYRKGFPKSIKHDLSLMINQSSSHKSSTITYYPDIYASAGYGAINQEDTECVVYDGSFLDAMGISKKVEMIQVRGDSMLPYVSNGDFVIIERTSEAKNGDIVIINYQGDLFIKQLQKNPQTQTLSFISPNKEYPSFEIKGDEVASLTIIGILKALIRPF